MRLTNLCLLAIAVSATVSRAQAPGGTPVFEVTPLHSTIKFSVKGSVSIAGKFDKWDAALTFQSPDVTTGVLAINIQADSVDTGSGMKNGKLKSEKFFDVENNPTITFQSTKFVQTSPNTVEVDGNFTIRGASNPEKLTLIVFHKAGHLEEIEGKMIFNRKHYGMTGGSGIPFVKIGDHVDVKLNLKVKHVSGSPLTLSQHSSS